MPVAPLPNNSDADLDAHLAQIDELGLTVIADVLGPDPLRTLPAAVDRAMAVRELHPGQNPEHVVNFNMCANLVNHAPVCAELCLHPAVYSLMQRLLGDDAVLSTIAALEPKPGATGRDGGEVQELHRDGLGQGLPVKGLQGCQSLWLLDDMDPQNGATRFGIGTHKLDLPKDANIEEWVKNTNWIDFLTHDKSIRSNTGITFKISESWFLKMEEKNQREIMKEITTLLVKENVAYDINGYPKAPPSFRIWGGGTVDPNNIKKLLPWIDWAYNKVKVIHA